MSFKYETAPFVTIQVVHLCLLDEPMSTQQYMSVEYKVEMFEDYFFFGGTDYRHSLLGHLSIIMRRGVENYYFSKL